MNVIISNSFKNKANSCEMKCALELIEKIKEDEFDATFYAQKTIDILKGDNSAKVIKAEGKIMFNPYVLENIDVWIDFIVLTSAGQKFDCGAYLTDMKEINNENKNYFRNKIYSEPYKETNNEKLI